MTAAKEMRRHDARILALSALFCWEVARDDPAMSFAEVAEAFFPESPRHDYANELFMAAVTHAGDIDHLISEASQGWPLHRMPRVDLSILRLAVAEAFYLDTAPGDVIVDEAVELSKEFSNHASPRFVNGVLGAIFREAGYVKAPKEE